MNATTWTPKTWTLEERPMTETTHHEDVSGANKIKLVLAWSFVGIPLLWGVLNTLAKAALLFQ